MKYLVQMKPLEPYSFGDDQDFSFVGAENHGKSSYIVHSKLFPEQTTILGLFRYLLLEAKGFIKSDFQYSEEQRNRMNELVGPSSFSFEAQNSQNFGMIHSISPVFLINDNKEYLVVNPYHNSSNTYIPYQMTEKTMDTSYGRIHLVEKGQYKAKEGHASGYYNLMTQETVSNPFTKEMFIGNKKQQERGNDDSFFKWERIILDDKYSFAVFLEADEFPSFSIGYMGRKKSAFSIVANEVECIDLEEKVQKAFSNSDTPWFYALSDLLLDENTIYTEFCIVEEKKVRNLETILDEKNHVRRMKRSQKQYNLVQSGSVFYKEMPSLNLKENLKQIGYNYIVQLGGK